MTETAHFPGSCPYLLCLETGPHDHPVCPDCGAVRYGNIFCITCRQHWQHTDLDLRQAILEMLCALAPQTQETNP